MKVNNILLVMLVSIVVNVRATTEATHNATAIASSSADNKQLVIDHDNGASSHSEQKTLIRRSMDSGSRVINKVGKWYYTGSRGLWFVLTAAVGTFEFYEGITKPNILLKDRGKKCAYAFACGSAALALFRSLKNGDKKIIDSAAADDSKRSGRSFSIRKMVALGRNISAQDAKNYLASFDRKTFMRLAYAAGRMGLALHSICDLFIEADTGERSVPSCGKLAFWAPLYITIYRSLANGDAEAGSVHSSDTASCTGRAGN